MRKYLRDAKMVTKAQKTRVITLLVIVGIIALYILFLLVGKKLMSKTDTYYIKLQKQSVSGLNVGTDVKYYGIAIGKVIDISVNSEDIAEIIVTITVKEKTPIKNTAEANLSYQSIATGLKQIEITGGDNSDKNLNPGDFIKSGKDIFNDISGKAEVIAQKVETLLNNLIELTARDNSQKFMALVDQLKDDSKKLDTLLTQTNKFMKKNNKELEDIVQNASVMIIDISEASRSAKTALNSLNGKIDSKEAEKVMKNLAEIMQKINDKELAELVSSINSLVKKSEDTVVLMDKTFVQGRGNLLRSLELFKETLENINEFAILIKDNPDILIRGKEGEK